MNHRERVNLLRPGIARKGGIWADFGSGNGAFTLAAAELIGPEGIIYAVDRDARALLGLRRAASTFQPPPQLHEVVADFTQPLNLPPLDGAIVANALHFVSDAAAAVKLLRGYLSASVVLIVVEYDTARAGRWVPHPLPFARLRELCETVNAPPPCLLGRAPSLYHGVIYAAALSPHGSSGARGLTIGRNVWGVKNIRATLAAFKAVIHDGTAPSMAMEKFGLQD